MSDGAKVLDSAKHPACPACVLSPYPIILSYELTHTYIIYIYIYLLVQYIHTQRYIFSTWSWSPANMFEDVSFSGHRLHRGLHAHPPPPPAEYKLPAAGVA